MSLKPCPFCGTEMHQHGHCFSHPWPKEGDCLLRHYSFDKTELWNTRTHPTPRESAMSLIERLLAWPATENGDALSASFVGNLMSEAASTLEAQQAEIAALREVLTDAREALSLGAAVPFVDPRCSVEVTALCDAFGYGAVMSTASVLWRGVLKESGIEGGEFCAGPCRSTAEQTIAKIDAALNHTSKEKTNEDV